MADHTESLPKRAKIVDEGLLMLDRSLKVIAFDRGAHAILRNPNQLAERQGLIVPREVLDSIRRCKPGALSSLKIYLKLGKSTYICRTFLLEWLNWLASQPMVAVHMAKIPSENDPVQDATVKYNLTSREHEVLRGISLGLSSKTIAERMKITPNTVKAFLRLIMTKMGVDSRAAIVATLLHKRTSVETSVEPQTLAKLSQSRDMYEEDAEVDQAAAPSASKTPEN